MLNTDNQSNQAVLPLAALTTFAAGAPATNKSVSVDTKDFHAAFFALATDRALLQVDADAFTYTFEDSNDNITFDAVPENSQLPMRKNPDRNMVIAQNSFLQTVGVFSTRRYVKLVITGTADTNPLTITPIVVLKSDLQEFTGYDPADVPSDGLP